MKVTLNDIFRFSKLLNAFGGIERSIDLPERERKENDIEHSYHLAMLAWYIADSNKLTLNKDLLLKYALIHDLVEVYAGDTFLYSKNQYDHDSKKEREEKAQQQIAEEFKEFGGRSKSFPLLNGEEHFVGKKFQLNLNQVFYLT